jgi:hypothetical protein
MLNRPYDAVIGMGDWCGVAQNLRRHFRTTTAYPMDWWVARYSATCRLLDDNFAHLFQGKNLAYDPASDCVRCSHYGILHAHDFLRDSAGKHIADLGPQLPALREKYAALVTRMDAAAARSILVVRHRLGDEDGPAAPDALHDRALGLYDRLAARWPGAELDMLVVESTVPTMLERGEGRITFDALGDTGEPGQWQPRAWSALLNRQGVTLRRPQRKALDPAA